MLLSWSRIWSDDIPLALTLAVIRALVAELLRAACAWAFVGRAWARARAGTAEIIAAERRAKRKRFIGDVDARAR